MKAFTKTPVEEVQTAGEARSLAVDWQHWQSEQSLSMGEMVQWQEYFGQLADKFPDLKAEFQENGII